MGFSGFRFRVYGITAPKGVCTCGLFLEVPGGSGTEEV